MSDINKYLATGRLTRDPDLSYTPNSTPVSNFGLAVNEKIGEGKEKTTFVDVKIYGKQAELANKFLSKGRKVFIDGMLRLETWEKDGQKRSRIVVLANSFQFMDAPKTDAV